jgi:hypothetical protein
MFQLIISLWPLWILLIATVLLRYFAPTIKGWFGEKQIAALLARLPKDEYYIMNDLLIPVPNGTTQIDHVVVSPYGVFVIETKNYKGWISGNEYKDTWTQSIYRHKERFMNPLHQNYGHIQAIKALLPNGLDVPFISVVAFSPNCTLKVTSKSHVIYFGQLVKTIRQYQDKMIHEDALEIIKNTMINNAIKDKESRKKHVETIRENISARTEVVQSGICPKCGGTLLTRKGKHGAFFGCSNYPACRYTKPL